MAKVIFSVGKAHPLYKKVVDAEIISDHTGYDGRQIYGRTLKSVHYDEDPYGIVCYHSNGDFIRFETAPAHDSIFEGYIEKVVEM